MNINCNTVTVFGFNFNYIFQWNIRTLKRNEAEKIITNSSSLILSWILSQDCDNSIKYCKNRRMHLNSENIWLAIHF
jgi:hypothetical protein